MIIWKIDLMNNKRNIATFASGTFFHFYNHIFGKNVFILVFYHNNSNNWIPDKSIILPFNT
jgi:hypothetical protein